jgi:hypothetical protein
MDVMLVGIEIVALRVVAKEMADLYSVGTPNVGVRGKESALERSSQVGMRWREELEGRFLRNCQCSETAL